jgi:hypothetical protein
MHLIQNKEENTKPEVKNLPRLWENINFRYKDFQPVFSIN